MKIIHYTLATCTVALSLGLASPAYALLPHWTTQDDGGHFTDTDTASDGNHDKWIDILSLDPAVSGEGHDEWIIIESATHATDNDHKDWIDVLSHTTDGSNDTDGQDFLIWQQLLHKADERLHRWGKEFRERNRHHRRHGRDHHRVPQVPVPAAVWLFGSGLIGLVGVARRKKSKTI